MSELHELIEHVIDKNPTDFETLLHDILAEKSLQKLSERRIEIAESLYGEPTEDEELEEADVSEEDLDDLEEETEETEEDSIDGEENA